MCLEERGERTVKHFLLCLFSTLTVTLHWGEINAGDYRFDDESESLTHKAFGSVVHQAQLEALLVLESFSQSVSEAVGGKHALPALLKLAENTLGEKKEETAITNWIFNLFLCPPGLYEVTHLHLLIPRLVTRVESTFKAQKMQASPRQKWPERCLKLLLKMSSCQSTC